MAWTAALLDLTPLRSSRPYRLLWVGSTLSSFGGQMTLVAVLAQVWQSTGSTVWTGLVGIAQAVPMIVFGLFAGSLVDAYDRRRFYRLSTAGQLVATLLLAGQALYGPLPPGGVLVLVGVAAFFVSGSGPVVRTFIPRLLPRSQVAAGVALNRIGGQAAMLAGPALGGLVVGWLGVAGCYAIDSATFVVALLTSLGLPRMLPEDGGSRPGLSGVLAGLAFLTRNRPVRGALLTDLAATVLCMPVSLFPLLNAERFGNDPRALGLFLSAIAAGGVLASLLSGTFTRNTRPGLVMLAGSVGWGLSMVAFGLLADPWLGLLCLVLAGAADTVAVVARSTIVQLCTPDGLLGRVIAAELIVGHAGPNVGNLQAGIVARLSSGTTALISGGLLAAVAVAAIAARTPELRKPTHGERT